MVFSVFRIVSFCAFGVYWKFALAGRVRGMFLRLSKRYRGCSLQPRLKRLLTYIGCEASATSGSKVGVSFTAADRKKVNLHLILIEKIISIFS